MKYVRWLLIFVLLNTIMFAGQYAEHKFRTAAQKNETLYTVMLSMDAIGFIAWSGGDIGYNNYYKWQYATWRKSPDRNIFEKIMFWDRGLLFYDASNPPKKYRYEQTG